MFYSNSMAKITLCVQQPLNVTYSAEISQNSITSLYHDSDASHNVIFGKLEK